MTAIIPPQGVFAAAQAAAFKFPMLEPLQASELPVKINRSYVQCWTSYDSLSVAKS